MFYLELPRVELAGKGEKGLWVFLGSTGSSGGAPRETQDPPQNLGRKGEGTLKNPISKMASG